MMTTKRYLWSWPAVVLLAKHHGEFRVSLRYRDEQKAQAARRAQKKGFLKYRGRQGKVYVWTPTEKSLSEEQLKQSKNELSLRYNRD